MVGTMIVAAIANVSAAAVAASFALTAAAMAVNFAVSMIVSRVFGQDQQSPQDSGTRQQVPPSSSNAIPIVYGDAYLGGTFVDAVLSIDQKSMYYVVAVSCVSPNGQFSFDAANMYYGDRLITFDGVDNTKVVSLTDEAGNVDTKISGNLYINLYTSTAAGTITSLNGAGAPSTVMGGADIDAALRWPASARQMNGLAFAIIKLNYNQDAGTTSLSPITFAAKHYLNATGAAKPGDVWYDYITNAAYGGAVDASFVDSSSVTALNSYADQTITYTPSGGGSATQARYRMNGVLDAGQTVLSNLDKIMTCCDSWMAYNAALGKWSIVINKSEAVSYAFNDDNIIGEVRVSATDITQSINQVEAKFPDKSARDQPNFVNIATPSILRYPNEPDNKYSVTYDLCNDSVQAQYLANRILEQSREDLIVSFSTTYFGIQVDAGAVVSVTNSSYGWTNKLFRVVKVNEASLQDGSLGAKLEMSEYSAAVYDDFAITQYAPVPNSDLPSVVYFSALTAPVISVSNPSSPIPNFNVQVTVPLTGRVTYGELYYTSAAIPTATDWRLLTVSGSIDGAPATPGATYTFQNQVLPTGASTTETYYFAYVVGNAIARSNKSPISAAFVWTPTGMIGPAGENGLTALTAYLVQAQNVATPAFTTPTAGASAPAGWSLSAPAVAVGQVLWYIQGRYNSNGVTVGGVGANNTAWTGPVAANVFQDIRSDNWNGSNPPTAGVPATYGTAGYYIQRSTGDMYANSFYGRGIAQFDGFNSIPGSLSSAIVANASLAQNAGIQSYTNNTFVTSGAVRAFNQSSGNGNAIYASHSGTGDGLFANAPLGRGVLGSGNVGVSGVGTTGVSGAGGGPGGIGVYAIDTGGGVAALDVVGAMRINNTTLVTNLNADYLDNFHGAAYSRVFATNSGDANPASSRIVLAGDTATGIAGAYVGTSGSSDTVTFTVQTTSPSDIRLKKEIENTDLGLEFVNKLRPVSYKLISDPKQQKGYGFIANEVEDLIGLDSSLVYHEPDWKVGNEKGFKTIHYPSYIAVLTKAIQELSAEIEKLKAKG